MPVPFLTIVIPVYNRPELIIPCVKSILCAAIDDVEIIIVDDCSTDDTLEVCNHLAAEHKEIFVISLNRNGGQGHARDVGLRAAKGEYVFFVDSDDEVISSDFSSLLGKRETWVGTDVVVFNYITSNRSGANMYRREDNKYIEEKLIQGEELGQYYPDKAMWLYFFNRDFLLKNGLHPFSLAVSEDRLFVCEAIQAARSLYASPLHVYHYIRRDGGMSMSKTKMKDWIDFLNWYRYRLMPHEKWNNRTAVKRTMERLILSCSLECIGELPIFPKEYVMGKGVLDILCLQGAEPAIFAAVTNHMEVIQTISKKFAYPIFICPAGATAQRIGQSLIKRGIPISGFIDKQKTGVVSFDGLTNKISIKSFSCVDDDLKRHACILVYGGTITVDKVLTKRLENAGFDKNNIVTL